MMNRGLGSIKRYVSGGQINAIYDALFDRPADSEGMAHYAPLLANKSYEEAVKIIAGGARNQDIATEAEMQQAVADFNALMDKGDYGAAASFASNAGVDPNVVANYVNENYGDRFGGATVTADTVKQAARNYDVIDLDLVDLGRPIPQPSVNLNTVSPSTTLNTGANTGIPIVNQLPSNSPEVNAKSLLDRVYNDVLNRAPTQAGYDYYLPKIISGELNANNIVSTVTGGATSGGDQQAAINFALQKNLGEFDNRIASGDFTGAKSILDQSINQYYLDPTASYANIAEYLNKDPKFANIRAANEGKLFDVADIRDFGSSVDASGTTTSGEKKIKAGMDEVNYPYFDDPDADPGRKQITVLDEAGNIVSGPPDKVIPGIPKFARQTQSDLTFAPLRRGLAQLRPAMYMPGLTSGQAPLGGSGFTPEALRTANQGLSPADRAYLMDVGGVSPAEASAALGTPVGQLQAEYNQLRPGGLFSTGVPAPRGLPEDFVLQTGAYGAPTPTFLALPEKKTATSAAETPLPSGSTQNTDTGSEYIATDREGGLIKMAEGGGPPKMTELSAKKAGSTFDIADYIDDQGRLVGGYSKPIYDENRVITGYDYRPYERDVVFGKELRDKEAALQLTDAEREQMMIEMAMRQGRTGILPTTGGLAGIEIGDPMMRRRPQYYSTVEQFRPRYAEGGLANVAQNLAERGRKGDSMLVHMAPEEVAGLRALARAQGTDMTINPRTGLPEAFSLRKLFKAASFILPFIPIPGLFGMSSLLTKSILSGVAAGASAKGGFDFKQALGGGLRAYALGSLGEKMGGGPTPGGAPTAPTTTSVPDAAAVEVGVNMTGPDAGFALSQGGPEALNTGSAAPISRVDAGFANVSDPGTIIKPGMAPMTSSAPDIAGALPPGVDTVPGRMASIVTPEGQGFGPAPLTKGTEIAMAGLGGFSLEKAAEEQRRYDMEAAAIRQEEEERERRFEELARRTLGQVAVKSGGQINLAKGGMTYMEGGGTTDVTGEPRMVQGTGDGMSDSVPATIEGVQEARLANDEFVIPADVVADIGNGSSNAGAKKLYNAMDRIRKARHGTTKQPPEIRAERLMPA
jgi:hypothetical protein